MANNKVLTLAFVHRGIEILLGYKKRGFGAGRWNGFGGKVEQDETIETGAKRELLEESGLEAINLEKIGILMFEFCGNPQLLEVHVFQTNQFKGTPVETDEMLPKWYDIQTIPFEKMWPDDVLWFPLLLSNQKFYGYVIFDGMDTIVDYTLKIVDQLETVNIPSAPLDRSKLR